PNNAGIKQKDSGGTVRDVLNLVTAGSLNIGDGARNLFFVSGSGVTVAPSADNQVALGASPSNRFSDFRSLLATIGACSFDSGVTISCTSATSFRPAPTFTNTTSDSSYPNFAF